MANNTTRKGLSVLASIALAAASLVGISAPAQAAVGAVEPVLGTSATFVAGTDFKIRVNGTYATTTTVSWEITGVPAGEEDAILATTSPRATVTTASEKVRISQPGAGTVAGNTITLNKADTTSGAVLSVRAFVEANGVAGYQDGEETAAPLTVTLIALDELTATTTITSPLKGDGEVVAKVVWNVNQAALEDTRDPGAHTVSATVEYSDASSISGALASTTSTVAGWSSTQDYTKLTFDTDALTEGKTLKVTVSYDGVEAGEATATVSDRESGSFTMSSVVSANAADSGATGAADSRKNSAFSAEVFVADTATPDATTASGVAGAKVSVTVATSATMSNTSAQSLTVNGTKYTLKSKLPGATDIDELALVSDADGKATITLETTGFVAADTISLTVTVDNLTAQTFTFTQRSAAYTAVLESVEGGFTAVAASANTVAVKVRDQFKVAPANGTHVIRAVWSESARAVAKAADGDSSTFVPVVDGAAALKITDNGSGAGVETYTLKIGSFNADGTTTDSAFQSLTIDYKASALAPNKVAISTHTYDADDKDYTVATKPSISNKVFAAVDTRLEAKDGPSVVADNKITIAGSVKNDATALKGQAVTLASAGMLFRDTVSNSAAVYAVGSITVLTDNSGNFSVEAWSNKSGDAVVTVTSGAVTEKVNVTYLGADAFTGTSLVVTAPATVLPGSTLVVKALLTDKWGNGVDTTNEVPATATATSSLKVTYVGPGLSVGTDPSNTDEDGAAQIARFLGANDSGTITVTFSYDENGDGDYKDADDLVVAKTITIGAAPVTTPVATGVVNAGSFNGYVAVYAKGYKGKTLAWKIAGKWFKTTVSSDYQVFQRKTVAVGLDVNVDIYIDGVKLLSKTVTTK